MSKSLLVLCAPRIIASSTIPVIVHSAGIIICTLYKKQRLFKSDRFKITYVVIINDTYYVTLIVAKQIFELVFDLSNLIFKLTFSVILNYTLLCISFRLKDFEKSTLYVLHSK